MISHFIGVDPGGSGGIAVIDSTCEVIVLRSMPDSERDTWELVDSLPYGQTLLEKVHARPAFSGGPVCGACKRPLQMNQGITSTFTFGTNYGFIRGCLIAAELPFEEADPKIWIHGLRIPPKKKTEKQHQWKARLKSVAQQMFPELHITLKTCDALLIAEYLRRSRS